MVAGRRPSIGRWPPSAVGGVIGDSIDRLEEDLPLAPLASALDSAIHGDGDDLKNNAGDSKTCVAGQTTRMNRKSEIRKTTLAKKRDGV